MYVCMYVCMYVYKFQDRHFINNSIIFLLIGLNRTPFFLEYVFSIGRCLIRYYLAMWDTTYSEFFVAVNQRLKWFLWLLYTNCLTSLQTRQYNRFKSREIGRHSVVLKKLNWSVVRHFQKGGVWFIRAEQFICTMFKYILLRHPLFYHSLQVINNKFLTQINEHQGRRVVPNGERAFEKISIYCISKSFQCCLIVET
jgi:hypothetical protein